MARATGTISLAKLIELGVLKADDRLVIRRRSQPEVEASLTERGTIHMGRNDYATPSAAARAALGGLPTDGWLRWRIPRLDYATLAKARGSDA